MLDMFKGMVNSPETTITNNISNADTIIYVLDETRVPDELPNTMTLGTGAGAETVKVLSIEDNAITVERGFQGVPKTWNAGTVISRNFTEYDYEALKENIKELDEGVEENKGFIGTLTGLLTTAKNNLVAAINEIFDDLETHKADNVSPHPIYAKKAQDNWIAGTLQNGWSGTLQYRKNSIGQIEIAINATAGTTTQFTTIATLPYTFKVNGTVLMARNTYNNKHFPAFYLEGDTIKSTGDSNMSSGNSVRANVVVNEL